MALGGGTEKIRLAGTGGEDRRAMFAVAASMRDLDSPQLGLCGTWVRLQIGASNVGVELPETVLVLEFVQGGWQARVCGTTVVFAGHLQGL